MTQSHSFRNSAYERRPNEQYFTQPWCSRALMKVAPIERLRTKPVWEPSAGRGDITRILQENEIDVFNSDIDVSNFDSDLGRVQELDFLSVVPTLEIAEEYSGIVMNPPYGGKKVAYEGRKVSMAEAFVRHALATGVDFVAAFLRTDFNHSVGRRDLWENHPFAYEVALLSRPRWDWWYADQLDPWDIKSPMHNFSWFVWDRHHSGPCTQFFVGPKDVSVPDEADVLAEGEDDDN